MKVAIVLGATGLIGRKLVDRLAKEDSVVKIVAVTRRTVEYASPKVINEVINFENIEEYGHIFKGDVLFSCLGTTVKQAGTVQKQRKVDLEYQYTAAKISSENNVAHYILVSSYAANEKSKSPYLKMKGELEQKVLRLNFKQITILQPSLLKGERESFRLGETLSNWFLPIVCKLSFLKKYRPISGDEVAKKMVSVSLSAIKENKVYRLDEVFCSKED
ncbi:oxidoreductase [Colwellia asteriadis]|uniref:Oxidoreductase n=1 Tax=Colwellia asteriadis TaxID=517723 RepID=A0ABP3WJM7_9GAMM